MTVQRAENMLTEIDQEIKVAAPPEKVFRSLLDLLSKLQTGANNQPMPMTLEEWPGGRWFRDPGNGAGHLWGFVQSIRPPTLIELYGPMFMSHAVANNIIFRIEPTAAGAKVTLRHQVLGAIPEDYRDGMRQGWNAALQGVKRAIER